MSHEPDATSAAETPHVAALSAVRAELARLEHLLAHGHHPVTGACVKLFEEAKQAPVPAWMRVTKGEQRLPVAAAILAAVALQLLLPDRLAIHPIWLLPGLELALFIVLIIANPVRITREHPLLRAASLALIVLISLANAWSVIQLVLGLLRAQLGEDPGPLLASGLAIWLTNVIAFALWYWEFDRGGPVARAHGRKAVPDFQFVQMDNPALGGADWEPYFLDYLYLSFTNTTAFSPTDVMPLSRWAKMLMLVQSAVSLVTIAVIISRAVSLFK
jgi:uncharacterized membrane protein